LMQETSMRRVAAASAIGTTLEWYDFALYNAMAGLVFNKIFFPSFDPLAGTLLAFSTYAVGYFARPLGGIICGRLGDMFGRRPLLIATVSLMGATTTLVGLLPGYATIGVLSPLLLALLRFIQGAALGGEWAGAVLLSVEHGRSDRRGINASWSQCGTPAGTLLATAALGLTTYSTTTADFVAWAWRIPFLISVALMGYGLWLRRGVPETPQFLALEAKNDKAKAPIREVIRQYWSRLIVACSIKFGPDAFYNLIVTFSLTYMTQVLLLDRTTALIAVSVGSLANLLAIPLFGALSDRCGRRAIYAAGVALAMIWAFAFFVLLGTKLPLIVILAVVIGLIIHASMWGPQSSFITEQFPTRLRYTGSSLSYTFAGFVAAATPAVLVALLREYPGSWLPSLYVVFLLTLTAVAVIAAGLFHEPAEAVA
jgi:MFS family permease